MNKKGQFELFLFILLILVMFLLFITFLLLIDKPEDSKRLRDFCINNGYYDYSISDLNYNSGYCFNSHNEKRYFSRYKDSWRFEE